MNKLGDKLRLLRKQKGLTQEQLSKELNAKFSLNTDRVMISKWETGFQTPVIGTLKFLANFFQVSLDYLNGDDMPQKNVDIYSFDNIMPIKTRKIPLLGEIACGEPIYADEDRESYVEAGTDVRADFCLRAKGDSMINARILDGDIVFIRSQPSVENGEIAAVIIDDEATLKRVYYYPESGKLVLNPANPAFEPFVYVGEELNQIRILGKAVAFQSDVK